MIIFASIYCAVSVKLHQDGCQLPGVNIGSGYGLVPSGKLPLPDADLCYHMASLDHNELKANISNITTVYHKATDLVW